ncbi:uncharacterized protein LOC129212620 isoform X2 [Grus americana]|nr:uncharacterized protein LOC129200276 isoform X2 [Grus americana]XP_054697422.1 uncharacterized protein LOC129212620 isoform X2 [Grus americana]
MPRVPAARLYLYPSPGALCRPGLSAEAWKQVQPDVTEKRSSDILWTEGVRARLLPGGAGLFPICCRGLYGYLRNVAGFPCGHPPIADLRHFSEGMVLLPLQSDLTVITKETKNRWWLSSSPAKLSSMLLVGDSVLCLGQGQEASSGSQVWFPLRGKAVAASRSRGGRAGGSTDGHGWEHSPAPPPPAQQGGAAGNAFSISPGGCQRSGETRTGWAVGFVQGHSCPWARYPASGQRRDAGMRRCSVRRGTGMG